MDPPSARAVVKKVKAITVAEFADAWVGQRTLKPRTRSMYNDLLRLHVNPALGDIAVKHLTTDAVRAWFAALGTVHTRLNSHAYALLHAIMATAVSDGLTATRAVCRRVMNPPRKRAPVVLSVQEVAALAEAIKPDRLKALR